MILISLAGSDAWAQCRLEGIVLSADGRPIAGATVRVDGPEYRRPMLAISDESGRYQLEDVKAGTRVRIVALLDNRPVAQSFALVTLEVETVNLKEDPLAASAPSAEYVTATEGPAGAVAGIVMTTSGEPLEGVRVTIGDTSVFTTSDASGRYMFDRLRPGIQVDVNVAAEGFQSVAKRIAVAEKQRLVADFTLTPGGASLSGNPDEEAPRVTATTARTLRAPGNGEYDLFRSFQFLPGVAAALEARSDLSLRGGAPGETRVSVDGFTLFQPPNSLALIEPINPMVVSRSDLRAAPFGATDGGRLAGSLRLGGPVDPVPRPSGVVDVSGLGVGARFDLPLGDQLSVTVAGRSSPPSRLYDNTLDWFSTSLGVAERDRAPRFSGGTLGSAQPGASFHELDVRVVAKPTAKDRLTLSFHDGRDAGNDSYNLPLSAPEGSIAPVESAPGDTVVQASRTADWSARGFGTIWTHSWTTSATTRVTIGRSMYDRTSDQAWILADPVTGADISFVDSRGGSEALAESNRVRETRLRVDHGLIAGLDHALAFGGEITALDINYASQTEVAGGAPVKPGLVDLLRTSGTGRLVAVYAGDAWRPNARLTLSPGIRLARYDRTASTFFEPRVSASYQLIPVLRLKAAWSIDHQVDQSLTREDRQHGDGSFWALADGSAIPVAASNQGSAGAVLELPVAQVSLELYSKRLDDLTMFAPRLYPGLPLDRAQPLLYNGFGRARGMEFMVRHQAPRNALWTSYSLSRAEYTYAALEASTFPSSLDPTHEFKVGDTVTLARAWSMGAAWVIASGRPYTPATGTSRVWTPSGATVYEISFDAKNSARLSPYHRLDVSTERRFMLRGTTTTLGATVYNVYDRKNLLGQNYETTGRAAAVQDALLMGRAVNAFVRIGF